jgi:hypothetical protein
MAFNISEFQGQVNKRGLAVSNLFLTRITFPGALGAALEQHMNSREIPFYCRSVQLPDFEVGLQEVRHQGYGMAHKRAVGMSYQTIPMVFMVDANFGIKKLFHRWNQGMINHGNGGSAMEMLNGRRIYEHNYHEDYAGTVEIQVYSWNQENITYTYKLNGAFPVSIGGIQVAWENNAEVMTITVNMAYDSLTVDGADSGKVTGLAGSGNGILGFLSSLNTIAQAVGQIRKPRGIQDLIVQTNNIGTILNNLPGQNN